MKGETLVGAAWALWDTQESLLQNYRSIFISTESILLSLSVTVLSLGNPLFSLLLVAPGIFLHSLWRSICSSRGRDVSFAQRLIEKIESGEIVEFNVLGEFKRYQKDFKTTNGYVFEDWVLNTDEEFHQMQQSKTRIKMDKYLPNSYLVLWGAVIGLVISQTLRIYIL